MFCIHCGNKIADDARFCPGCGKAIGKQPEKKIEPASFKINNESKLMPCLCTQCGAELVVDSTKETAICTFCNTPFMVSKAINNYNLNLEKDLNVSHAETINIVHQVMPEDKQALVAASKAALDNFKKAVHQFETDTKLRMIPPTVRVSMFGKTRPGTVEDINKEELAEKVGRFILNYEIPTDELALKEFYFFASNKSNSDYYGDDMSLYDEFMIDHWETFKNHIGEKIRILYSSDLINAKSKAKGKKEKGNADDFFKSAVGVAASAHAAKDAFHLLKDIHDIIK